MKLYVVALALASLLATSHFALKAAAALEGTARYALTAGALCLFAIVFFLYSASLRSLEVGRLYPIYTGISVIAVFLGGAWLFREPFTGRAIAGCALVVAGIYLLGGEHGVRR